MNLNILIALLVAWGVIYILKKLMPQLLVRQVGRAALAEVGKRALTRLPEEISLLRTNSPAWNNPAAVQQQVDPLLREGFEDLGAYSVDKMPGALIRMLAHPDTNAAAHVYDHPKSGSWIEFATRYTDGSSHTLSTLPPTGMKHPDWFRKIQADKSTPTNLLYLQFLKQRQSTGIKPVAPYDTIREFEEVFRQLADWRQQNGISVEEVANVTVKWAAAKSAAAGKTQ